MSRFTELLDRIDAHGAGGRWPAMLAEIAQAVLALLADPMAKTVVFGSPEVDARCTQAGAMAAAALGIAAEADGAAGAPYDDDLVVYAATELIKPGGGHGLALRDVILARPQSRHVVLLTNLHDKALDLPAFTAADGTPVPVVVAPAGHVGVKTAWLLQALARLRPGRLMLFNHHYDAACIAAAQPALARQTLYFHHCDHDMALGLYLPHALHVDCSNIAHERCRTQLGVRDPLYWPLVSADLGARPAVRDWRSGGRSLVTGSHGSAVKFLVPGRYGYFDVIRRRLAQLPGVHRHVGALPEAAVAQFRQTLASADIDPARFDAVPPVPSLWRWLVDSDLDVVISSFPVQGAKGLVETMGAGLPVLMHDSAVSKLHSALDLVYPEVLRWRTPDELIAALAAADAGVLAAQAAASRRHYERWHHPRELAYAVNNGRLSAPMPPLVPAAIDTLALYWRG